MKAFLVIVAIVFCILAVIFYISSIRTVDDISVVNIQDTVFCAACAVICAINSVGAMILNQYDRSGSGNTSYRRFSKSDNNASLSDLKDYKMGALDSDGKVTKGWKCKNCEKFNPKGSVCKFCGQPRAF